MKQLIAPIAIIVALIAFFVVIDRKDFLETKPVAKTKPAETKPAEVKPTTVKPVDTKPVAGTKPIETKPVVETKPSETNLVAEAKPEKLLPAAVPVLSPEEALLLVQKQEKEREEAKKRGWVFYEERFGTMQNLSSSIQQTINWHYVAKDDETNTASIAKKQDYFSIKSEKPIEYVFSEPLYEYTIYQYSLCCSVKGNGMVVLSQKGGKEPKEWSVESNLFETFVYVLGNGESLNSQIVPSVSFKGDLQVESITLQQKAINNGRTICLASIEDISSVPDIKKSNYPDCYYTAKLVVKDILDGPPVPQNIQLLIPAFLDNKIDPLSAIMKKGNWEVSIRPFSSATKAEQEIEQVDEIESYLFAPYILVAASSIKNIPELTVSPIPILEGENYVSPFDNPINPPLPDNYVEDSRNEIKKELAKVNSIIEQVKNDELINVEFQSAWDEKQKSYDSLNSTIVWAREKNSYFSLPKKWVFIDSSKKISEKNVDAIVDLNHLFESQGIQFVIQIVPDYRDIAALVLNPEFQKYGDQKSARAAKQLLERGVEVQYISDELVKNAFNYERLFFYPYDFHPDEGTTDIMTSMIANRLKKYGSLLSKDLNKDLFSKVKKDTGYGNSLKWPKDVDIGSHEADSNVQVPYILYNKKEIYPNSNSNILVFGNSFAMEPMTHDAYISYLAPKILHVCSCRLIGGSSALTALPQLFLSSPEKYLKNKIFAVLPISIKYLTEDNYVFPNVLSLDVLYKNMCKSIYLTNLSLRQDDFFLSSYTPVPAFLRNTYRAHPSASVLSKQHPKISLMIPDNSTAKTVRISIAPCQETEISVAVNGTSYHLPSQFAQKWEYIEHHIDTTTKQLTIELDFDNSSSNDVVLLIGSVSLFK